MARTRCFDGTTLVDGKCPTCGRVFGNPFEEEATRLFDPEEEDDQPPEYSRPSNP
jgi:hypothetical protein